MGSIGDTLKNKRIEKNISLQDVEQATKIRLKYIEALENEDFDILPGRVYTIGFLKSYAKYLELDPSSIVFEFKSMFQEKNDLEVEEIEPETTTDSTLPSFNFPFNFSKIAIILLACIAVFFLGNYIYKITLEQKSAVPPKNITQPIDENPVKEPDDNIPQQPDPNVSEKPPAIEGLELEIQISSENQENQCWVRVLADKKEVFSGTLQAGDSKKFEAQNDFVVKFGNPGPVKVLLNGEDQGTIGTRGRPIEKTFSK